MAEGAKVCAECGDKILGRADKKFCSDACRNAYHYQRSRPSSNYVRNVINILKRNRRIMEKLNPGGKTRVHRDKLSEKGYNFNYITNLHITKKGGEYHFCFEQGFIALDDGWLLLVRRDEYLEQAKE
jgi:predicted nucleic acid-binding Zn ribbon protein